MQVLPEKDFASLDGAAILQLLYDRYQSVSVVAAHKLLEGLKMKEPTFNRFAVAEYAARVDMHLKICGSVTPPAKEVAKLVIRNIQPKEFREFVRITIGEQVDLSNLQAQLRTLGNQFHELSASAVAIGMSFAPSASAPKQQAKRTAVAAAPAAKSVPAVPSAPESKPVWNRDMCLGCGHVTSLPHRRFNVHTGIVRVGTPRVCLLSQLVSLLLRLSFQGRSRRSAARFSMQVRSYLSASAWIPMRVSAWSVPPSWSE